MLGQNRKYLRMTFKSSLEKNNNNNHNSSTIALQQEQGFDRKNLSAFVDCPKKLPGFFSSGRPLLHYTRTTTVFKRNRHNRQHQQRHKFLLFAKNSRLFGFEPIVSPLKRTRRSKHALTRALCSSNLSQYCHKGKQ